MTAVWVLVPWGSSTSSATESSLRPSYSLSETRFHVSQAGLELVFIEVCAIPPGFIHLFCSPLPHPEKGSGKPRLELAHYVAQNGLELSRVSLPSARLTVCTTTMLHPAFIAS